MSFEDFERLPRRLGWKYEYYEGEAHVTVWEIHATLLLDLSPCESSDDPDIGPVEREPDVAGLTAAFVAAFGGSPDYAGIPSAELPAKAMEYLAGFFGDRRGRASPRSLIARAQGRIVGAALVKERDSGPLLDCLFVHPAHARQGWATALMRDVVNGLAVAGAAQLVSFVLLANEPSLAWHLRFGFRELPDALVAAHRARVHAEEARRGRRFGALAAADIQRHDRLASVWREQAERLRDAGESASLRHSV